MRLRPVLLAVALLALVGCASAPTAIDPRVPLRIEPAMRREQVKPGVHALRIAVRDYVPLDGAGPRIRLVGAVHIASRPFYADVQAILDQADCVLFEGVSESPDDFKRDPAARKKDHLYTKIADALGLITQFEGVDYRRDHFVNADLSPRQMLELLEADIAKGGESAAAAKAAKEQFGALTKMMKGGGGGMTGMMVNLMLGVIERSPKMRATLLLTLASVDPDAESGMGMGGKGGARLGRLILEDRNAAVIEAVRGKVDDLGADRTVAVFYGAAHLRGLEDTLIRQLGYVPAETRWLTAFEVDAAAAGLSDKEVEELGRTVRSKGKGR